MSDVRTVTVLTPCFNEAENVRALYERVRAVFTPLGDYHYEHLFIDNASVSLVELDGDQRPRVVGIGWSPHPGWLKPPEPVTARDEATTMPNGEQKT